MLNQLYQYSPLQTTVSVILLALVGNRPQTLTIKQMLQEFIRHRVDGHPPPDRVPAGRGPQAQAHRRRAADRPDRHRPGDPDDPQFAQPGRGQGPAAADSGSGRTDRPGTGRRRLPRCFRRNTASRETYSLSPNQSEAIVSHAARLAGQPRTREPAGRAPASCSTSIAEYLQLLSRRGQHPRRHPRRDGRAEATSTATSAAPRSPTKN